MRFGVLGRLRKVSFVKDTETEGNIPDIPDCILNLVEGSSIQSDNGSLLTFGVSCVSWVLCAWAFGVHGH